MLCFIGLETRENLEYLKKVRVAITKAKESVDIKRAGVAVAGRTKLEIIPFEKYFQNFQKYK